MDGTNPFLALEAIDKRFGDVEVLRGLSLGLARGEVLSLLGLSGSGKTTALRLVAGFETPDAGRIVVDGESVADKPPAARGFGMVFQHYALFPHMTVAENVAFGLGARGDGKAAIAARVDEMLALVDLAGYGSRGIGEISGGQQQRVALARALAPSPRVLLLDEPLSNLDPTLRERTRHELRAAIRSIGITTLLVTHEQEEAFDVGDRVAVLHQGRLLQVGLPEDLYDRPASRFVATFVGRASPIAGRLVADERGTRAVPNGWVGAAREAWSARFASSSTPPPVDGRTSVDIALRPESLRLTDPGATGLPGVVVGRRFGGASTFARVQVEGVTEAVEVLLDGARTVAEGTAVHLVPREDGPPAHVFHEADR